MSLWHKRTSDLEWTSLTFGRLDLHYFRGGVAPAEHGDVDVLDEADADLLHGLHGGVADHEGDLDVLPVVVELFVQGGLQLQLPLREEEILPDSGGGLPALPGWSELDLPDGHVDAGLLPVHMLHDGPDVVLHPAGLPRLQSGLEGDGGGGVAGELEVEGESLLAQLTEQPVLQPGGRGRGSLSSGEQLGLVHHQLLLEIQPHRLLFLSPVPEGADQLDGESLVVDEVINLQDAVHWVRARGGGGGGLVVSPGHSPEHSPGHVVNKVSPSQKDGHGTIGGAFLEHSECDGHADVERLTSLPPENTVSWLLIIVIRSPTILP